MFRRIFDALFPPQCAACEIPGTGLCAACFPAQPLQRARLGTLNVIALGEYAGALQRAVLALKRGRRDVADALARRLLAVVPVDSRLVAVPTTVARRRERGFDGCELVAKLMTERADVAWLPGLRQTRGDRQRGRDRSARLRAIGRFAWRGNDIAGTSVTLLDDVVTTGSTLEDCARTLRAAGARVEQALVIAKA